MRKLMEQNEQYDEFISKIETKNKHHRRKSSEAIPHKCPKCERDLHVGHFVDRFELSENPKEVILYHECNRCAMNTKNKDAEEDVDAATLSAMIRLVSSRSHELNLV